MLCNKLVIRPSKPKDHPAIAAVETQAYGRKAEARLVEQLVPAPEHTLSLVAECDGMVIGHILLTGIAAPLKAMAVAPLAVLPAYREMQVGSELVRNAIRIATQEGHEVLFVLGDNGYFERFGFSAPLADAFQVKWQGKRFMALELKPGSLVGKGGKLEYPEPFHALLS